MSDNDIINQPHSPSLPDAPSQRQSPRWVRLVGYASGVLLAIGLAALAFWITTAIKGRTTTVSTNAPEEATAIIPLALQRPLATEDELVEKSGVRLVYVAVTGAGGLIDLRFQVVDPDKANAVHDEDNPPAIVDEATGVVANSLFMGHSHHGTFHAGQIYYLIFENPGNLVQRGGSVSVLLGDAEVDHVVVK